MAEACKIRPLRNYLVVKKTKEERFSSGGIFVGVDEENVGVVLAVGPGKEDKHGRLESMWDLKEGDKIVFSPNGNHRTRINGVEFVMIRRDAVIGLA